HPSAAHLKPNATAIAENVGRPDDLDAAVPILRLETARPDESLFDEGTFVAKLRFVVQIHPVTATTALSHRTHGSHPLRAFFEEFELLREGEGFLVHEGAEAHSVSHERPRDEDFAPIRKLRHPRTSWNESLDD